jgi:hypothetical protein
MNNEGGFRVKKLQQYDVHVERLKRGISQGKFAELCGIGQSYLSQIESEKVALPDHIRDRIEIEFHKWDRRSIMELPMMEKREVKVVEKTAPEEEKFVVKGVSKDEPAVFNKKGGGQSRVMYRFDLLDAKSMFEMTKVLKEGAEKYGADNWRLIDIEDHLNHMLIHAYAYLAGDKTDEHLSHIMCRAMFAQGVAVQTEKDIEKAKQQEG